MTAPPGHVTVNQRILVHLLAYTNVSDRDSVPPAVTQQGIADALGVRRSHVTLALQMLHRHGLVEADMARIVGGARRRKAYALTPLGYLRGREMNSLLAAGAHPVGATASTIGDAHALD